MITEDYVSFETAKLLKEKGFNSDSGDTSRFYLPNGNGRWKYGHYHDFDISDRIECPTLQMAIKWLREEHNIFIGITYCIYPTQKKITWTPEISTFDSVFLYGGIEYNRYEEACEAAIKYCLENLI